MYKLWWRQEGSLSWKVALGAEGGARQGNRAQGLTRSH